jgi:rod shape-determining protein MreD
MTLSVGTVLRLSALVVVTVVLQLAVVSEVTLLGTNVDLAPLLVLSVGLLGGPVAGAAAGFFTGLLVDMSLVQTLGLSSLLLIGIGYLAGRYGEVGDRSHSLIPLLAGAAGTFLYSVSFSISQFLLGVDSAVSPLIIRDTFAQTALNGLIALAVFPIVRRVLRPSLVDAFVPRRRMTTTVLRAGH